MKSPILALVLPCYNEESVLSETIKRLSGILKDLISKNKISEKSYMIFVDDGSVDKTWDIIETSSKINRFVKGIKLSRNQGHQIALLAGMEYVVDKCDCMISMDADLQDDINAIYQMIEEYYQGNHIVYGVRSSRNKDTIFKRLTAEAFYKLMNLMGVNLKFNHADFRLMSNLSLKCLLTFSERNLFIRGLVPLIGFKSSIVYYERQERYAGESKYPLKKMLSFAIDGITSFSITPLRLISVVGFIVFIFSMLLSFYVFYIAIFTNKAVPGWASTVLPIYFMGGYNCCQLVL